MLGGLRAWSSFYLTVSAHRFCWVGGQGMVTVRKNSGERVWARCVGIGFVFESEGKAVPLMKITEVLTDSFFAINTLWH